MLSQLQENAHLSEQIQILRQDVLKKNMEIVRLQDAQKGRESRSLTDSSMDSAPRWRLSSSPDGKREQDFDMAGIVGTCEKTKEVEDLESKLKTATEICTQQEKYFSKLVKDLEQKLSEAIAGRDELLTLRQQESANQQQLIYQLQAALQQTRQTLELQNENISDREKREKLEGEKFSQAQTALAKIYNVLKDEEVKRGNSKILTERTCDHDHLYTTGDLLAQVLSNILKEDGERISDMKLKNLEFERQLQQVKETNEADKVRLIREYENKLINLETDHTKSLDIAANRTLTERNRIDQLLHDIGENKLKYEKTIGENERMIVSLEENIKSYRVKLDEKNKQHEMQHDKDANLLKEVQSQLENLKLEKAELLNKIHEKETSETRYEEKINSLENQLKEITLKLENTETNYKNNERELLNNISHLKEIVNKEHEVEERSRDTDERLKKYYNESIQQISTLKEELKKKTDEVLRFMEECRILRDKLDTIETQKSKMLGEKEDLAAECENLNKKIVCLQEEKSNLSNMVRENVDDLTRAKNVINNLQIKLDEREKSLEVFNKQETDLAGLLFQKHLVGESLLQERQQIVGFLEEKVRENDELKKMRDSLAQNLESKIQVLTEMEVTCRALEKKLEVRSNELDVIMEDRNKAVREVENKVMEMTKLKEERDSLVTLMNGKQSEKDQEIAKLLSRLKSSQHDLVLTKKVLEAKKEANEKAIKMASVAQEEITTKRKEIDGFKDRIKWLQDSLHATAEEKMHFENKASELSSQLRNKNRENENIRTELDQMMKYYDSANGQVSQMEMALEKAGIKFAESQALIEKLEQNIAKIKLQYSLEVKELEMKVKSVESKGQHVQVVKPFRYQDGSEAGFSRYPGNVITSTRELNTTKQRLTEEVEVTEGFKTLLKDLHELMNNIKDSSVMFKRESNMAKTSIAKHVMEDETEREETTTDTKDSNNKSSRKHENKTITNSETSTITAPNITLSSHNPSKIQVRELKTSKSVGIDMPLHSSSPKNSSPVFDNDMSSDYTTYFEHPYSDISDDESYLSGGKQEQTAKLRIDSLKQRKPRPFQKSSKLKEKTKTFTEPEDVDSLLMSKELPPRSHRRAKEILDILTLKGQELSSGNKKIAELISRQEDGIKRCQKAKLTIKEILN